MRILIAPDKFKGSLTAVEATKAIARGVKRVFPRACVEPFPMADGGEGTVRALVSAAGGRMVRRRVHGPLGKLVVACFGRLKTARGTAVIEMAQASGLNLIQASQRNPLRTSTFGTGELIRAAFTLGCRKIIIGIGGSATVDGGAGMVQALGVKFFDARERELRQPLGGGDLDQILRIDSSGLKPGISNPRVLVATDVQNPLLGPMGAARMFGPQKGATPAMVERLERNLRHYAKILCRDVLGNPTAFSSLVSFAGGGAAGGLGVGLRAFLGAEFASGAQVVMRYGNFDAKLRRADLVITGEGRLDAQSLQGKAPLTVARQAKRFGLPVLVLAGSVATKEELGRGRSGFQGTWRSYGIDAVVAIKQRAMNLDFAQKHAARLLEEATIEALGRLVPGQR